MKNIFLKAVTALLFLFLSLEADIAYTNALFGVEGGYSNLGYKYTPDSGIQNIGSTDLLTVGIKAGAETESVRTFFNVNYYNDSSSVYDYLLTYGVEVEYKFVRHNLFNIYAGFNAGYSQLQVSIDGEAFNRTINNPYFGASLGTNVYLGNSFELEIGGRINAINAENIKSATTYKVDNIFTGYVSLIYKWKMD